MLQRNKLCNILHKSRKTFLIINKGRTMFKFEEQYKKFEEVLDRTQAMYDFWTKAVFTAAKDLFKVK